MADHPNTSEQLDGVTRSVTAEKGGDGVATVQAISQSYRTDLADLWDTVTNPERLPRWFAPVTGDFKLGGRYQVKDNAGGTIETCDPPNGFSATWEFGGQTSTIEVRLTPEGPDRTRFTLIHTADIGLEWWDQYGPGATGVGWDLALLGLALHVETGIDAPAETADWVQSDDARAFTAESSRRWADASVAAGTPHDTAHAAAERTTAFFTGA